MVDVSTILNSLLEDVLCKRDINKVESDLLVKTLAAGTDVCRKRCARYLRPNRRTERWMVRESGTESTYVPAILKLQVPLWIRNHIERKFILDFTDQILLEAEVKTDSVRRRKRSQLSNSC